MPTVGIEGLRFYYEEQGSGPPLLLVHGTGGDAGALRDLAGRLSSSYRVITYDRRGFTRTEVKPPAPKEYVRRHADDASALLRELGAPHARVFGWSMGGVIALALAVHHADDVSRLVLYDPPLHAKKHMGVRFATAMGGALALGKAGMYRRAAKRFFRHVLAYSKGGKNAFDELDERVRDAMLTNARTVIAELEAGTGEELSRSDLAKIGCPIGIVSGQRSAKFLVAAADRCAEIFPSARVVRVPTGDHLMTLRQPDVLAAAIRDLLA
jgi:pimeloyl-ACP methyl ester carboxylesterase